MGLCTVLPPGASGRAHPHSLAQDGSCLHQLTQQRCAGVAYSVVRDQLVSRDRESLVEISQPARTLEATQAAATGKSLDQRHRFYWLLSQQCLRARALAGRMWMTRVNHGQHSHVPWYHENHNKELCISIVLHNNSTAIILMEVECFTSAE